MSEQATFVATLDASGVARGLTEIERLLTSGATRIAAAGARITAAGASGTGSTFLDQYASSLISSTNSAVQRMQTARQQLLSSIRNAGPGSTLDAGRLKDQVKQIERELTSELQAAGQRAKANGIPVDVIKDLNKGALKETLRDVEGLLRTTRTEASALSKSIGVGIGDALQGAYLGTQRQAGILNRAMRDLDKAVQTPTQKPGSQLPGIQYMRKTEEELLALEKEINLERRKATGTAVQDRAQIERQSAAMREKLTIAKQITQEERRAVEGPLRRDPSGRFGTMQDATNRALAQALQITPVEAARFPRPIPPRGVYGDIDTRGYRPNVGYLGSANALTVGGDPFSRPGSAGNIQLRQMEEKLLEQRALQTAAAKRSLANAYQEEHVTKEAIAAQRAKIVESRAGGGGGGGGRGGRPQATDPFDAFLGGLSSRGFDTGNKGFRPDFQGIAGTAGTLIKYAALGSAIALVTGATSQGTKEFLDYTDSLTDVANALTGLDGNFSQTRKSLESSDFENQLQDFSRAAGSNVGEQLDAAARAQRAFGVVGGPNPDSRARLEQIGVEGADVATQLKVITGTNIKDQIGNLVAIGQAYGLTADNLQRVSDAVANTKNVGGADFAEVAQGLANFAQPAAEAGIELQEAGNLLSVIIAKTDQSGRLVATRLSRITSIASSARGQATLQGAGVDTTKPLLEQFGQLQSKFDDGSLSPERQKAITASLGGTANIREFQIALKEANNVLKLSGSEYSRAGAGADLFNQKNKDLAGQLRQIRGDIKNLFVELGNSGIFASLGVGLKVLEPGLKTLNDLLELYNELPKPIRTVLGLTLALGAASRLVGSLAARAGLGAALEAAPIKAVTTKAAAAQVATEFPRTQYGGILPGPATAVPGAVAATTAGGTATTTVLTAEAAARQKTVGGILAQMNAEANLTRVQFERVETQALMLRAQELSAKASLDNALTTDAQAIAEANLARVQARREIVEGELLATTRLLQEQEGLYAATVANETILLNANATAHVRRGEAAATDAAFSGVGAFSPVVGPEGKTGKGANQLLGGLAGNAKLIAGFGGLIVADMLYNASQEANKRISTANTAADTASQSLGLATDAAGLQASAEAYRAASAAVLDTKGDGFFGFVTEIKNQIRDRDPDALSKIYTQQAKDADKRADDLRSEAAKAAIDPRDPSGAFQDVQSIDGLKAGLDALDSAGRSAETTIDALTRALGRVDGGQIPNGLVLPHQRATLETGLSAAFNEGIESALLGTLKNSDRSVSYDRRNVKNKELLKRRFLPDGSIHDFPLLGDIEGLLIPPGLENKVNPDNIDLSGKDLADQILVDEFQGEKNAKKRKRLTKKFNKTVTEFFDENNVTGAEGGVLSDAELDELANKAAEIFIPKGLVGKEKEDFRTRVRTNLRDFLNSQLNRSDLILDQETSSEIQRILISQAGTRAQQSRFGNSADFARASNPANKARLELEQFDDAQRGGDHEHAGLINQRRQELTETIDAEASLLSSARKPTTTVEAARTKLAAVQAAATDAARHGADGTEESFQAQLEAERELQTALEAEAAAYASYNKSKLGADDAIGRANADYEATLRQAAVAAFNGDIPGQYAALAAAADQANQIREQQTARGAAGRLADLDPRDTIGRAKAELENTKAKLAVVTVRGDDGGFTKAYLDLVSELKANAQTIIESRAELSNAARSANTNPGSSSDQARTAVLNAQTTLNATKPKTLAYYAALGSLNEAKLAYARDELDAADANTLLGVPSFDKLARAQAELKIATRRRRFEQRVAKGDYDTTGNLTGRAPDFEALGKGIGSLVAEGIHETDYQELGENVGDKFASGIASLSYFEIGAAVAQDFADGIMGVANVYVSALAQMASRAAAGGRSSPDSIDRIPSTTYAGGRSSINNKQVQSLVRGGVVSQQYGNQSSRYAGGVHKGVDIAVSVGTPVHAAMGGTVLTASYQGAYGNSITIRGTDGNLYRYGHLASFSVRAGARVKKGQVIGRSGNTGNSTGPHLHFEVSRGGQSINPEPYLPGGAKNAGIVSGSGSGSSSGSTYTGGTRNHDASGGGSGTGKEVALALLAEQEKRDAIALLRLQKREARILSRVDPRSSESAARAAFKNATLELKFYHKNTIEYYEALAKWKEARFALANVLAERRDAKALASIDVSNPLAVATVEMRAARRAVARTKKGTLEYYQAVTELKQAQNARQAAAFDQRLSDIQIAEQLGKVTHLQYIQYLEGEHNRLSSIAKRTRQQQDELNQIDLLIKGAKNEAAGQFNIGDIKLPTIYEVRRYIKATTAGLQYQGGQPPLGFAAPQQVTTTNTTFNIDGADTGFILQLLNQYLGSAAVSRTSTTTRKVS